MTNTDNGQETEAAPRYGAILAIYLVGLTIGGLYVGMVSPVRTVIQLGFGIDDTVGIWMINIYTLFYAALIPVIGKLADLHGRKRVFIICLAVFSLGCLLCGASASIGGFGLLLAGRVIQATGACGMIPVANAEIGTVFPPEKRGMALGLAAGIAGIANVFGAAAGSGLLDLLGSANWPWMFFLGVPLCLADMVAALFFLPDSTTRSREPLDIIGAVVFVLMILMLLLSLRSLDFFDLPASILRTDVLLPLIAAIVLALAFRALEHRAADPIFHLEYFHSRPILITMIASFFIGCTTIFMTLIPEMVEFTVNAAAGSGGYYIIAVGVFSLFGPPVAGKLIDRFGPKRILMSGQLVTTLGFAFLAFAALPAHSPLMLIIGMCIMGLGMGFSMGAPTNYMILESTTPEQSTSAIASIALVRQLGTSLAPALLVGFIANGTSLAGFQGMLMCVMAFCLIAAVTLIPYHSPGK